MRLSIEARFAILGEAGSPADAARLAGAINPDVILLDADLSGTSDAALDLVRTLAPAHSVVVLSLRDGPEASARMLEAGAAAFVRKHDPVELLIAAIDSAASSGTSGEEAR